MGLIKHLFKRDQVRRSLCWLAARYIRLVYASGRWSERRADIPERFWQAGKPFILAFWHGRLLMMPTSWSPGAKMNMLISQHRDGALIAEVIAHFGLGSVRGSTRRGGTAALRGLMTALKRGECVGITPDGPRGPRMRASGTIVDIARLAGAPIVPAAYSASPRRVLSTWDRFVLALPFGRGVIVWGEPITVARRAEAGEVEAARRAIEEGLNAVTSEADRLVGAAVIEPAPAGAPGAAAG
ncbi:MAG: lysophospholipid acyltransferase family protein [Alphaproteobacteria bacterium]